MPKPQPHEQDRAIAARIAMIRAAGVPVSAADEVRMAQAMSASLKSLEAAVPGSLFDTEPQTFDIVMRQLAGAVRP